MANTDVALRRLSPLFAQLLLERAERTHETLHNERWSELTFNNFDHPPLYEKFVHHADAGFLEWLVAVSSEDLPHFGGQLVLRYGIRDELLVQLAHDRSGIYQKFRRLASRFLRRDLVEAEQEGFPLAVGSVVMISSHGQLERVMPL